MASITISNIQQESFDINMSGFPKTQYYWLSVINYESGEIIINNREFRPRDAGFNGTISCGGLEPYTKYKVVASYENPEGSGHWEYPVEYATTKGVIYSCTIKSWFDGKEIASVSKDETKWFDKKGAQNIPQYDYLLPSYVAEEDKEGKTQEVTEWELRADTRYQWPVGSLVGFDRGNPTVAHNLDPSSVQTIYHVKAKLIYVVNNQNWNSQDLNQYYDNTPPTKDLITNVTILSAIPPPPDNKKIFQCWRLTVGDDIFEFTPGQTGCTFDGTRGCDKSPMEHRLEAVFRSKGAECYIFDSAGKPRPATPYIYTGTEWKEASVLIYTNGNWAPQ